MTSFLDMELARMRDVSLSGRAIIIDKGRSYAALTSLFQDQPVQLDLSRPVRIDPVPALRALVHMPGPGETA